MTIEVGTTSSAGSRRGMRVSGTARPGGGGGAPTVPALLGIPGQSSPVLTDFTTFNTAIAPRKIDHMLFFQNLDAEPFVYSAYTTWSSTIGAGYVVTLSPGAHKLSDFTAGAFDTVGLDSNTGLVGLANTAKALMRPVYVRLAHEFNLPGNVYGTSAETAAAFITAWQHIVTVFRTAGATNVKWIWNPNVWGLPGSPAVDPTTWYPGNAYVDVIGLDGYLTIANGNVDTPATLFLSNYNALMASFNRPFAICEVGVAEQARLSSVGGKAGWYNLLFSMIKNNMPNLMMMNSWQRVFAGPNDTTISSSGTNPTAAAAFQTGITSSPFV